MLIAGPNLTLDRTLTIAELRPGEVLRFEHAVTTAGGKGVNVARAALEGIAWRVADIVAAARETVDVSTLRVDGGLINEPLLLELQADAIGASVDAGEADATVLGAAALAAVGAGVYGSLPEVAEKLSWTRHVDPTRDQAWRDAEHGERETEHGPGRVRDGARRARDAPIVTPGRARRNRAFRDHPGGTRDGVPGDGPAPRHRASAAAQRLLRLRAAFFAPDLRAAVFRLAVALRFLPAALRASWSIPPRVFLNPLSGDFLPVSSVSRVRTSSSVAAAAMRVVASVSMARISSIMVA